MPLFSFPTSAPSFQSTISTLGGGLKTPRTNCSNETAWHQVRQSLYNLYAPNPLLHSSFIPKRIPYYHFTHEEEIMQDFLFLATTVVFFAIAIGYADACDRL
jgi:hypothetical protein